MAKSRRELSKEIYRFVEDSFFDKGEPIIQQDIVKHFINKYHIGGTTVIRCLDELVNSKSPFSLKTFYDNNRYYALPTVSRFWKGCMIISIIAIFLCTVVDVLQIITWVFLSPLTVCIEIGFWVGVLVHLRHTKKQKNQ